MSQPQYTTNDPYLASFVISEGGVLAGCQRLGPKKVEFRFVADRRLHEKLRVYWSGLPTVVTPNRLFAALRTLKSRTLVQPGIDSRHTTVRVVGRPGRYGRGTALPQAERPGAAESGQGAGQGSPQRQ